MVPSELSGKNCNRILQGADNELIKAIRKPYTRPTSEFRTTQIANGLVLPTVTAGLQEVSESPDRQVAYDLRYSTGTSQGTLIL